MFDRYLHVESKRRTCLSFCLSNIGIFQYVKRNSTCTHTRQNALLLLRHSRSACMFKVNFNMTAFIKTRLAQSVEHRAIYSKVVVSSPTVLRIFHNIFCRCRRAPGRLADTLQMKLIMTFIRGI